MQGGELMVKRFQRSSQVSFPLIDPWPELLTYYSKKLTPQIGDWISKALSAYLGLGVNVNPGWMPG